MSTALPCSFSLTRHTRKDMLIRSPSHPVVARFVESDRGRSECRPTCQGPYPRCALVSDAVAFFETKPLQFAVQLNPQAAAL